MFCFGLGEEMEVKRRCGVLRDVFVCMGVIKYVGDGKGNSSRVVEDVWSKSE